jgi:hypothetical protein
VVQRDRRVVIRFARAVDDDAFQANGDNDLAAIRMWRRIDFHEFGSSSRSRTVLLANPDLRLSLPLIP